MYDMFDMCVDCYWFEKKVCFFFCLLIYLWNDSDNFVLDKNVLCFI